LQRSLADTERNEPRLGATPRTRRANASLGHGVTNRSAHLAAFLAKKQMTAEEAVLRHGQIIVPTEAKT